jgi:hypothetical protein
LPGSNSVANQIEGDWARYSAIAHTGSTGAIPLTVMFAIFIVIIIVLVNFDG